MTETMTEVATDVANGVANGVTEVASGVANGVTEVASGVANGVTEMASGVANSVTEMASGVAEVASNVAETASNVATVVRHPLKSLVSKIWEKIQEELFPTSVKIILALGGIYVGYKTLRISWNVWSFLSETFISGYDLQKRYGYQSWALVTDATSPLGRAFAIELGRTGFHVILVGNNFNKLQEVNDALGRLRTKPLSRIIVADLSQAYNDEFIEKTFAEIRELDVSMVVNNFVNKINGDFAQFKDTEIRNAVILNNIVPALLVRYFANLMAKREKRSAMINVTALGTVKPSFSTALYGGSQQFVDIYSRAIVPRFSDKVDILTYKACFIDPSAENKVNIFSTTPQQTALACLDFVGRRSETYGYWKHRLLGPMYWNYPNFRRFSDWLMIKTSQEIKEKVQKPKKSNILKHNYQ